MIYIIICIYIIYLQRSSRGTVGAIGMTGIVTHGIIIDLLLSTIHEHFKSVPENISWIELPSIVDCLKICLNFYQNSLQTYTVGVIIIIIDILFIYILVSYLTIS